MESIAGAELMGRYLETNRLARNYHNWLMSLADRYLGDVNLEIGSGFGDYTDSWASQHPDKIFIATDGDSEYVSLMRNRFKSHTNVSVTQVFLGNEEKTVKADCIVAYNVLEHIEDDRAALKFLINSLNYGGYICIFVPAFKMNYSKHDRKIGHFRRYRKPELLELFKGMNLDVVESKYVNSVGMFAWFVSVKLLNVVPTGEGFSLWDRFITPRIARFEKDREMRFGNSIWMVGRVKSVS